MIWSPLRDVWIKRCQLYSVRDERMIRDAWHGSSQCYSPVQCLTIWLLNRRGESHGLLREAESCRYSANLISTSEEIAWWRQKACQHHNLIWQTRSQICTFELKPCTHVKVGNRDSFEFVNNDFCVMQIV